MSWMQIDTEPYFKEESKFTLFSRTEMAVGLLFLMLGLVVRNREMIRPYMEEYYARKLVQEKRLKIIAQQEEEKCTREFEQYRKFFALVELELMLKEV